MVDPALVSPTHCGADGCELITHRDEICSCTLQAQVAHGNSGPKSSGRVGLCVSILEFREGHVKAGSVEIVLKKHSITQHNPPRHVFVEAL